MARQSERHSLEEKQKKGRGTKRKQEWNGDELFIKRRGIDTPSPISLSRPNSVTSSLPNDTNNIDVVNDDSDSNSTGLLIIAEQNISGRNTPDILRAPPLKMSAANNKSKTAVGGKVARPKKKGGSAAAAAGAMAGKLAASQAAFAAYGVPYSHLLSSNVLAVPSPVASSNPPSNHSSPRASPIPPYSTTNHTP